MADDVRGRACAEAPSPWHAHQSAEVPEQLVPVTLLRLGVVPRTGGVDDAHVLALASASTRLPPIIVHRPTMRVIDGVHRLRAAELAGRTAIAVRFFDGDLDDAFVLAVEANRAHGLPLSLADRKAAAARIIRTHPLRSDRWIARVSGLAATTVGALRRCSSVGDERSNTRIGRDGRHRPIDSSVGRRQAADLMRADPSRSLRAVARAVGIAPSTVLDVRNRISAGLDPVPVRKDGAAHTSRTRAEPPRRRTSTRTAQAPGPDAILHMLRRDPSLRFSEAGRALLRWLDKHTVAGVASPPATGIPAHCLGVVAALARHNARFWADFAERVTELEELDDHGELGQDGGPAEQAR